METCKIQRLLIGHQNPYACPHQRPYKVVISQHQTIESTETRKSGQNLYNSQTACCLIEKYVGVSVALLVFSPTCKPFAPVGSILTQGDRSFMPGSFSVCLQMVDGSTWVPIKT